MSAFRFIVLALVCYRITRLVTADHWPPAVVVRDKVEAFLGKWGELVTCAWCAGTYITAVVFAFDHYVRIPSVFYLAIAAMTVVGLISNYDAD